MLIKQNFQSEAIPKKKLCTSGLRCMYEEEEEEEEEEKGAIYRSELGC